MSVDGEGGFSGSDFVADLEIVKVGREALRDNEFYLAVAGAGSIVQLHLARLLADRASLSSLQRICL